MSHIVVHTLLLLTLYGVLTEGQEWSEWQAWSGCIFTDTGECGPAKRNRERRCVSGQCVGDWKQEDACFGPPCSSDKSATWTLWSEWTACTAPSCTEPGTRGRWRECRGTSCPEDKLDSVTERCKLEPPCKKDGVWSAWSRWSECSATCGEGYQFRQRRCRGGQHGGDLCTGADYHTKACLADQHICYLDASWGPWGIWGKPYADDDECKERTRLCEKPYPLNPDKADCIGRGKQRRNCD